MAIGKKCGGILWRTFRLKDGRVTGVCTYKRRMSFLSLRKKKLIITCVDGLMSTLTYWRKTVSQPRSPKREWASNINLLTYTASLLSAPHQWRALLRQSRHRLTLLFQFQSTLQSTNGVLSHCRQHVAAGVQSFSN